MFVRLISVALLGISMAFASAAHAQTDDDFRVMDELEADHPTPPTACGDGLVSSDATLGHCCWPGQAWSDERQRCAGSPTCPAGWEARGSLCVRGEFVKELGAPPPATKAPAVEAAPRPAATPAPVETAPRASESVQEERPSAAPIDLGTRARPYDPEEARGRDRERYQVPYKGGQIPPGWRLETKVRKGLVIPGSIILGVSYSVSVLNALSQMAGSEGSCVGNTAPIGLIPIIGPLAQGLAYSGGDCGRLNPSQSSSLMFFGVLASGHQVAGLIMLIVGVKKPEQFLVQDQSAMNQPSWDIYAGTQGTSQGLTLAGRF